MKETEMKKVILAASIGLFIALTVGACGGEMAGQGISKQKARSFGKADWWTDFCEEYNWYGDGECDEFCPNPDPDCQSQNNGTRRPVCQFIGTRSEGWYWSDGSGRIKYDKCGSKGQAVCSAIGSRSEGWYSGDELIVWDSQCHRAVGVSLEGEPCGGIYGYVCREDLYCHGRSSGGPQTESGVCRRDGYCESADDCSVPDNAWPQPRCIGYAICENNTCGWVCGQQQGVWSWTSFLYNGAESAHPYPNNSNQQWVVQHQGAAKIKLHFERIDLEQGYDWISIESGDQHIELDGAINDYWTPPFDGDQVTITLKSDGRTTAYGFKVDAIAIYEQLGPGLCNTDEDCAEGEQCVPHQCFNAFAPCYGDCRQAATALSFAASDTPLDIPDNQPAGIESLITVSGLPACNLKVLLSVDISHSFPGDLSVKLLSPAGEELVLFDRQPTGGNGVKIEKMDISSQISFSDGVYRLRVADHALLDRGRLSGWSLEFACR